MESTIVGPAQIVPLPLRAWHALRRRGPRYVLHKSMRRVLAQWPDLKRRLVYGNPQSYWTLRGGTDYFREQEDQPARTARSRWMAARLATYQPDSVLEIGCGYGKQLRALRRQLGCPLIGLDFSPTQLEVARTYLDKSESIHLVQGSGARLPFADKSFDLVLTSAVILHNPPAVAQAIRREVVRVARRWAAHNEDRNTSYNRYGYDTAAWYRSQGIPLAECGPVPVDHEAGFSQFCVAELKDL